MGKKIVLKILPLLLLVIGIVLAIRAVDIYSKAFKPNVKTGDEESVVIYIPNGSTIDTVMNILYDRDLVKNRKSLEWAMYRKNYHSHVYPGRYRIRNKMNNNELVNLLRAGKQEPVDLVLNNIRTIPELALKVSEQLETDPDKLMTICQDPNVQAEYGFDAHTILCMFIPNTYEFFWNTSAEDFVKRMHREYMRFWDKKRQKKAEELGLTPIEVGILASIVDEETSKNDEKDRIAGVYINRLKKGIPLQADPTIIYAIGDFSIKRVLKVHLQYDSPYNTYKYAGLPPGPIGLPTISGIDAVLNHENHNFYYFCAREDFSGYHNFAKTLQEHNQNARKYQQALNRRRIYR